MNWTQIILQIVQMIIEYVLLLIERGKFEEAKRVMRLVNKITQEKEGENRNIPLTWQDVEQVDSVLLKNPQTGITEEDIIADP